VAADGGAGVTAPRRAPTSTTAAPTTTTTTAAAPEATSTTVPALAIESPTTAAVAPTTVPAVAAEVARPTFAVDDLASPFEAMVRLSGTGCTGAEVALYRDGAFLLPAGVLGDGSWSMPFPVADVLGRELLAVCTTGTSDPDWHDLFEYPPVRYDAEPPFWISATTLSASGGDAFETTGDGCTGPGHTGDAYGIQGEITLDAGLVNAGDRVVVAPGGHWESTMMVGNPGTHSYRVLCTRPDGSVVFAYAPRTITITP
jgi:hypothetical protein